MFDVIIIMLGDIFPALLDASFTHPNRFLAFPEVLSR
jgi:hypothetical protein